MTKSNNEINDYEIARIVGITHVTVSRWRTAKPLKYEALRIGATFIHYNLDFNLVLENLELLKKRKLEFN